MTVEQIPEWTLGERMAKARKDAGLTQRQMAEALDVKEPRLASWETNRAQPRDMMDVLRRWAQVCEVPFAWLVGAAPDKIVFGRLARTA